MADPSSFQSDLCISKGKSSILPFPFFFFNCGEADFPKNSLVKCRSQAYPWFAMKGLTSDHAMQMAWLICKCRVPSQVGHIWSSPEGGDFPHLWQRTKQRLEG